MPFPAIDRTRSPVTALRTATMQSRAFTQPANALTNQSMDAAEAASEFLMSARERVVHRTPIRASSLERLENASATLLASAGEERARLTGTLTSLRELLDEAPEARTPSPSYSSYRAALRDDPAAPVVADARALMGRLGRDAEAVDEQMTLARRRHATARELLVPDRPPTRPLDETYTTRGHGLPALATRTQRPNQRLREVVEQHGAPVRNVLRAARAATTRHRDANQAFSEDVRRYHNTIVGEGVVAFAADGIIEQSRLEAVNAGAEANALRAALTSYQQDLGVLMAQSAMSPPRTDEARAHWRSTLGQALALSQNIGRATANLRRENEGEDLATSLNTRTLREAQEVRDTGNRARIGARDDRRAQRTVTTTTTTTTVTTVRPRPRLQRSASSRQERWRNA